MTEALFSIAPAGELISSRYYTITAETLARKIITEELIDEILRRCSSPQGIPGEFQKNRFTFWPRLNALVEEMLKWISFVIVEDKDVVNL